MMPLLFLPPHRAVEEHLWSLTLVLSGHVPDIASGQLVQAAQMTFWGLPHFPQLYDFMVLIEKMWLSQSSRNTQTIYT